MGGPVFMVRDILHFSEYLAMHHIDIHDSFVMNILIILLFSGYARLMKD